MLSLPESLVCVYKKLAIQTRAWLSRCLVPANTKLGYRDFGFECSQLLYVFLMAAEYREDGEGSYEMMVGVSECCLRRHMTGSGWMLLVDVMLWTKA